MLIQCPECQLQVSDKALACPHCGYPMKGISNLEKKYQSKAKHPRLPNGFGQITKLPNKNLRNPYRAMITVGKTETGKPIARLLKPEAYFPTYKEAYEALLKYHRAPNTNNAVTMQDLYDQWSEAKFKQISYSRINQYVSAWRFCTPIARQLVQNIRTTDLHNLFANTEATDSIQHNMRNMLTQMFDYAAMYEITDKNPARSFSKANAEYQAEHRGHIAFTDEELDTLWANISLEGVDLMLIQCYSGWRPDELCRLRTEDVNISLGTFRGGLKNKASKNREVPIHSRILPLVRNIYDPSNELLLGGMGYSTYRYRFGKVIQQLGLNPEHKPHDPRKTFVTLAKKYQLDEYAIKRIVGHSIGDITEKVYTERSIEWLRSEIEKIR